MSFEQFRKATASAAERHNSEQQRRMARARKEWNRYETRMRALGLHPLSRMEIDDWQHQLVSAGREIPETFGDTPGMRAAYALQSPEPTQ